MPKHGTLTYTLMHTLGYAAEQITQQPTNLQLQPTNISFHLQHTLLPHFGSHLICASSSARYWFWRCFISMRCMAAGSGPCGAAGPHNSNSNKVTRQLLQDTGRIALDTDKSDVICKIIWPSKLIPVSYIGVPTVPYGITMTNPAGVTMTRLDE